MANIEELQEPLTTEINTPSEEESENLTQIESSTVSIEQGQQCLVDNASIEDREENLMVVIDEKPKCVTGTIVIRINNSSVGEKKVSRCRRSTVKRNPLKNDAVMFSLNPFAKIQKQQARLQAEAPKTVKKRKSKREKKAFRPQPRPEIPKKQKVAQQKKPKEKPSPKPEPQPDIELQNISSTPEEPAKQQILHTTEPSQPESCIVEEIYQVVETEEYVIENVETDDEGDNIMIDIRPEQEQDIIESEVGQSDEDLIETDTEVLVQREKDVLESEIDTKREQSDEDLIETETQVLVQQEQDVVESEVYLKEEQSDEDLIETETQVLVQQEQDVVESEESLTIEAAPECSIEADLKAALQGPSDKESVKEDLGDLLDIDEDEFEIKAVVKEKADTNVQQDGRIISPEPEGEENYQTDFMDFLSPEGEGDLTIQSESEDDMDLKGEVTIDAKQINVSEAVAEAKPVCPQPVVAAKSDQDDAPLSPEPEANDEEVDFMDFL